MGYIMEKNGITAKPSKSFFAMQRLRVIGLIVSKLGIQVNPDRLQATGIIGTSGAREIPAYPSRAVLGPSPQARR